MFLQGYLVEEIDARRHALALASSAFEAVLSHLLDGETIFSAGGVYPVFDNATVRFGIAICYDSNFPEATAALAAQDIDLILCPANNMMRRENAEEWRYRHNEIRAERAKETGCWIVSSDVTGEWNDRISYGPTSVIDPRGCVVAQVPLLEVGMVVTEIDLQSGSSR